MSESKMNAEPKTIILGTLILVFPVVMFLVAWLDASWRMPLALTVKDIKVAVFLSLVVFTGLAIASFSKIPFGFKLFLNYIVYAIVWVFAGVLFLGYVNSRFDMSSETVIFSKIQDKQEIRSGWIRAVWPTRRFKIVLLNSTEETKWINVSSDDYDAFSTNSKVAIFIRAGFFGREWLASIEPMQFVNYRGRSDGGTPGEGMSFLYFSLFITGVFFLAVFSSYVRFLKKNERGLVMRGGLPFRFVESRLTLINVMKDKFMKIDIERYIPNWIGLSQMELHEKMIEIAKTKDFDLHGSYTFTPPLFKKVHFVIFGAIALCLGVFFRSQSRNGSNMLLLLSLFLFFRFFSRSRSSIVINEHSSIVKKRSNVFDVRWADVATFKSDYAGSPKVKTILLLTNDGKEFELCRETDYNRATYQFLLRWVKKYVKKHRGPRAIYGGNEF